MDLIKRVGILAACFILGLVAGHGLVKLAELIFL